MRSRTSSYILDYLHRDTSVGQRSQPSVMSHPIDTWALQISNAARDSFTILQRQHEEQC